MKRCKGVTLQKTSDISQLCPSHRGLAKKDKTIKKDKAIKKELPNDKVYVIEILSLDTRRSEFWFKPSLKKLREVWTDSWWMKEKEWFILRATWNTEQVEELASHMDFDEGKSPFPKLMRQKKKYPVYRELPDEIWYKQSLFGTSDIFYDHKPAGVEGVIMLD